MKTLTVSVASYNIEKFIDQALEPFLLDSIRDEVEVIIVNDGSKDQTSKIAHKYAEKYPDTFIVVDKENGGYGSTINTSLPMASGKYYKLLDGDDWYNPDCIKEYIDILKQSDEDLIVTSGIWKEEETGIETLHPAFDDCKEKATFSFDEYPKNSSVHAYNTTFKTSCIKDKGITITENCFYTDTEFLLKCLSKCNTIKYYNIPIYMYRIGRDEQSMSLEGLKRHYRDAVIYYKEVLNLFNAENISLEFRRNYLESALVSLGKYHLSTFYLLPTKLKKEYKEFDRYIKNTSTEIYQGTHTGKIKLLRKTKYIGYALKHHLVKRKYDNKNKKRIKRYNRI